MLWTYISFIVISMTVGCALDSGRLVGNGKRDGNELIDFVASNDLMDMDYKSIEDPLQP